MKKITTGLLMLFACASFSACKNKPAQPAETGVAALADSLAKAQADSIQTAMEKELAQIRLDSLAAIVKSKPVKGERTWVIGDFDGDGTQDTLYERYISLDTGKETNKDYDWDAVEEDFGVEYIFYLQHWTVEKAPLVRLQSKKAAVPSFDVEAGGAQLGFGYLENAGDLDGNGGDEIIYYIEDADLSNINSCSIATLKPKGWKQMRHWTIHEFDFFDIPDEPAPPPVFVRKKGEKVQYRVYDEAGYVWKRLNTSW